MTDRRPRMLAFIVSAAALMVSGPMIDQAAAQTDMTGRAKVRVVNRRADLHKIKATFRGVPIVAIPGCDDLDSWVEVHTNAGWTGRLVLDCDAWSLNTTGRYTYREQPKPDGSLTVRKLSADGNKLKLTMKGNAPGLLTGTESLIEVRVGLNGDISKYCGRHDALAASTAKRLATSGDAIPCPGAEGERAFWAQLNTLAGTSDASVALFDQATTDIPTDGRSWFLKGMMHMYRQSQDLDIDSPSQFVLDEVALARTALDTAVPLLADDTRIPGFAGSAAYIHALVNNDAVAEQDAIDAMRDSIIAYPIFNSFNFTGTVGLYVLPGDPLFAEAIGYVDDGIDSGCSPFNEPRICGNAGRALRNVEGSMLLFGDLYAKAGDEAAALGAYNLGLTILNLDPVPYGWQAEYDDRLANLSARIALYQDADPSNDPPVIGQSPNEGCIFCHAR